MFLDAGSHGLQLRDRALALLDGIDGSRCGIGVVAGEALLDRLHRLGEVAARLRAAVHHHSAGAEPEREHGDRGDPHPSPRRGQPQRPSRPLDVPTVRVDLQDLIVDRGELLTRALGLERLGEGQQGVDGIVTPTGAVQDDRPPEHRPRVARRQVIHLQEGDEGVIEPLLGDTGVHERIRDLLDLVAVRMHRVGLQERPKAHQHVERAGLQRQRLAQERDRRTGVVAGIGGREQGASRQRGNIGLGEDSRDRPQIVARHALRACSEGLQQGDREGLLVRRGEAGGNRQALFDRHEP